MTRLNRPASASWSTTLVMMGVSPDTPVIRGELITEISAHPDRRASNDSASARSASRTAIEYCCEAMVSTDRARVISTVIASCRSITPAT